MLTITREQFATLDQIAIDDFQRRAAKFLREEFRDETGEIDDEELLTRIQQASKNAAVYDIETEQGIVQFATLDILLGPEFHTTPDIAALLSYPEGKGDDRIEALFEELVTAQLP